MNEAALAAQTAAAQTTAAATLHAAQIAAAFAVIAAVISLLGAIVNALVARRNAIVQARTAQQVKHAEFRQEWINVLREQMSKFQALAYSDPSQASSDPKVAEAMLRVVMQMNPRDPNYPRLTDLMYDVMRHGRERDRQETPGSNPAGNHDKGNGSPSDRPTDAPDRGTPVALPDDPLLDANADFVTVCQEILKTEWDVTKAELRTFGYPTCLRNTRTFLRLGRLRLGWAPPTLGNATGAAGDRWAAGTADPSSSRTPTAAGISPNPTPNQGAATGTALAPGSQDARAGERD